MTYNTTDAALKCIQEVNGSYQDGRTLKATLGTTKYCSRLVKIPWAVLDTTTKNDSRRLSFDISPSDGDYAMVQFSVQKSVWRSLVFEFTSQMHFWSIQTISKLTKTAT